MNAVPVHVVEPVDGRVDDELTLAAGRGEVEALVSIGGAAREPARLEADRLGDGQGLPGLAVAMGGGVISLARSPNTTTRPNLDEGE